MIASQPPPRLHAPMTELSASATDTRYVLRYAHLGAVLCAVAVINGLIYFIATPHGDHRMLLEAICVPVSGLCIVVWFAANQFVGGRHELAFFYAFAVAVLVTLGVVIPIDGGSTSPLAVILILPVVYTAISYPIRAVEIIAGTVQAMMLTMMAVAGDWDAQAWHRFVVLAIFNTLAVVSALNRTTYQETGKALAARAMHDDLTGCLSYGVFNDCLRTETARAVRSGRVYSLLIADVDRFKNVNDTHGHPTGDRVLRVVADVLTDGTRAEDAVGRLGGDEFGILLIDTDRTSAFDLAERLRQALHVAPVPAPVTISVGLASWTGPADTAIDVLRRADAALYEAKTLGRDCTVSSD